MYFHLILNPLYHSNFVHGFFIYLEVEHNAFQVLQDWPHKLVSGELEILSIQCITHLPKNAEI